MIDMNKDHIDVTDCDLVALVKKAYALSQPQGLGFLHFRDGELSDADAQEIVNRDPRGGFGMDYVHGRAVKLGVTLREGRLWLQSTDWSDHSARQLAELLASITLPEPVTAAA